MTKPCSKVPLSYLSNIPATESMQRGSGLKFVGTDGQICRTGSRLGEKMVPSLNVHAPPKSERVTVHVLPTTAPVVAFCLERSHRAMVLFIQECGFLISKIWFEFSSSLNSDRSVAGQRLRDSLNAETSGVVPPPMGSLGLLGLGDAKLGDSSFTLSQGF